jgi:hypothetical protein
MRNCLNRSLFVFVFAFAALALLATSAVAETPGKHPAYLHARSDLAKARQLMNQPGE